MTKKEERRLLQSSRLIMKSKPNHNTWSVKENEVIYRWFYSSMEVPSQENLHFMLYLLRGDKFKYTRWWFCKLLSLYPTQANWEMFLDYYDNQYMVYHRIIWEILNKENVSIEGLRLIVTNLSAFKSKGTYRLASKILAKAEYRSISYEI